MRLGRAGRGRQVLLEDLTRGAVAEAAARGVVEPVGEPAEAGASERLGRALARQEAPDTAVGVLDAALLPGGVRVAEVGLHREVAVEDGVGGELRPAVEGDRPAGLLGQPPGGVGGAGDDRRRALVLVRQQEGEAALPLHQRGHVRLAGLLAEDQQVALPVAEDLPFADLRRPVLDPALARDRRATRPAAVTAPAPPARLRQVAVQAVLAALGAVDVPVDRLVADRGPAARRLPLQPPRDLLRRPAVPEPPDHVLPQGIVGGQLAATPPASPRQVLGVQGEVAAEPAVPVAEAVAPQLPTDGGRVPAEPLGDLADRPAGFHEAEEGASRIEVELAVGPGQRRLRGAIPGEGWGFAPRDRTHPGKGPATRRYPLPATRVSPAPLQDDGCRPGFLTKGPAGPEGRTARCCRRCLDATTVGRPLAPRSSPRHRP